jgi:hypothetical protein
MKLRYLFIGVATLVAWNTWAAIHFALEFCADDCVGAVCLAAFAAIAACIWAPKLPQFMTQILLYRDMFFYWCFVSVIFSMKKNY